LSATDTLPGHGLAYVVEKRRDLEACAPWNRPGVWPIISAAGALVHAANMDEPADGETALQELFAAVDTYRQNPR
jgi:hypothetical protein